MDTALTAIALALLLGCALLWLTRSRKDPLANAPKRPNRLREDSLALVVLVYLLALMVVAGSAQLAGVDTENLWVRLLTGTTAQVAGTIACLVVVAKSFDGGVARFCLGSTSAQGRLPLHTGLILVGLILAVGICPMVLQTTMALITSLAPDYEFPTHPTIETLHDPAGPLGLKVLLWLSAAVIAPVAEETFFRGVLQTFLIGLVRSRWIATCAAALAFSVIHVSQPHAIPALFVLAVLIGFIYERTGSLNSAIVIHTLFNLKTLIWDSLGAFNP
ncbi:MAG: CPBP family intramembrane metalloprotease [Phycisphaerales bacterium]|nr:MAG: CPBP family intramembrane metalloprotease [Phycisphaerales bacterium]